MTLPRIVIVGGGFAGYFAARRLCRKLRNEAEVVLLNPNDYFLYLPLLPEVAGGILDPRQVTVSISATLPEVRLVLGSAVTVDTAGHSVGYVDAEGRSATLDYEQVLLTTGSVNKLLPIPGVAQYAHGFRDIAEGAVPAGSPHLAAGARRQHRRPSGAGRSADLRGRRRGLYRHRGCRPRRTHDRRARPKPPSAGGPRTEVAADRHGRSRVTRTRREPGPDGRPGTASPRRRHTHQNVRR